MNGDLISVTHKANAEAKLLRVMRTTLRFARFASDGGTGMERPATHGSRFY